MWFQKKKHNKRHRRRNVLDVKLRSDQVRALRVRGVAVMMGVLFGTVFTLYVLWRSVDWALDRLVYQNRAFTIKVVDVSTDGEIAVDHLRRWSGVRPGHNLMALDLATIKANLELMPNIESVSVERLLPGTLRIRVAERDPIARVMLPRVDSNGRMILQAWLLDLDGTVMMPVDPKYRASPGPLAIDDLPAITGVNPRALRLGRAANSSRLQAALEFIHSFNRSGLASQIQLRQVDLSKRGVLVATTDTGAQVTLECEAFDRQLGRWRRIRDEALRLHKVILTLDLAVRNNVPVRWVESTDAVDIDDGRPT